MPDSDSPNPSPPEREPDLFDQLPEPDVAVPRVNDRPAPAGSRRALREAAAAPATLDELFEPEPHEAAVRTPRHRRRVGCAVVLALVLVLVGAVAAGGVWVWNTFGDSLSDAFGWGDPEDWEPGLAQGEAFLTIREGDTGRPVSTALYEAGVTRTDAVFYDYLIRERRSPTFYPGVYRLQQKMTAEAALAAIEDPANKIDNAVAISEGGTIESALPKIAETVDVTLEQLQAAVADPSLYGVQAASLEGWLFPAVYTFDPEATAPDIIGRMVERMREALAAAGVVPGDEQRVLTIASIIQREGRQDDFAKVSRVIQNRLADGMLLQMDSTAQYGFGELHAGVVSTSKEAQFDDNDWNTYVRAGLPAGPIANPGDAAIAAALSPVDGPWLYFVTTNPQSGETVFSTTYEEHEAAIRVWHEWCTAHPDQGC